MKQIVSIFSLLFFCSIISSAQVKKEIVPAKVDLRQDSGNSNITKPQKSITQGSVTVEDTRINYQAVAGTLILKSKDNKPTCSMFYVAYFKDGLSDESQRPVTFIYNGGPGSATLLLHILAGGPRRVFLSDTAHFNAPYKTVNNEYSLLDVSDLVFIDAPGTGFSRIITKKMGGEGTSKDFYGADPDAQAFAQFITTFLSEYGRWNSPKYLMGESYGTFRSALVSKILEMEDGVSLNGIILISQILNIGNMSDNPAMNPGIYQPYIFLLPSFAAVAWYHHKLPNRPEQLLPFLDEVKHFAENDYTLALQKGSLLDSSSFDQIAEKLHDYTGLSVSYIKKANLRVGGLEFEHELLEKEGMITGRFDARYKDYAINPMGQYQIYDPADAHIDAQFISTFNDYVRNVLHFGKDQNYLVGSDDAYNQWNYNHKIPSETDPMENTYSNSMPDLAQAMIYNPKMKVMLNMGYFDLATPFFEGEYEMHHLPIPNELQKNISYEYYYSGHMVYLHIPALAKLHDNVAKFINNTH
ncbi:MAG: hypothetical protein J0H55_10400 [Chitinophagaceae bacterium]|nr:hypothetical protein [Chitinophagaceae bacterium]